MAPTRIGLIGAGKHGSRYAKHIVEDIAQARLTAVCRRDRQEGERFAVRYGCAYYDDYRALINDPHVDAIVIVVPPAFHETLVASACQAQKPILIEKPFAISVAAARRMRTALTTNGVRCMVAHTLRFNTIVQTLKKHLPEIAPLHAVHLSQRFEPSSLPWLDRPAESGGGIVLHTGVHSFDLLRFLTENEVESVWCQTSRVVTKETEDNFAMMCRMKDPVLTGAVFGSRSTHSRSGLIELSGERGQLLGDHAHGFAYILKGWERRELQVEPPIPTVREALRAFVENLQHDTPFPITVEDGSQAVAIAEACYRSAANDGQSIPVERCE
jgi:predicted dehydrogenase